MTVSKYRYEEPPFLRINHWRRTSDLPCSFSPVWKRLRCAWSCWMVMKKRSSVVKLQGTDVFWLKTAMFLKCKTIQSILSDSDGVSLSFYTEQCCSSCSWKLTGMNPVCIIKSLFYYYWTSQLRGYDIHYTQNWSRLLLQSSNRPPGAWVTCSLYRPCLKEVYAQTLCPFSLAVFTVRRWSDSHLISFFGLNVTQVCMATQIGIWVTFICGPKSDTPPIHGHAARVRTLRLEFVWLWARSSSASMPFQRFMLPVETCYFAISCSMNQHRFFFFLPRYHR